MTILRFAPGDIAPSAGMFALVGRLGESTGFAIWRSKGEKLPHVTMADDVGPSWFVQVGAEISSSLAA
jgi:hypothetical protein